MNVFQLERMKGGWFVGDFTPTSFATTACETACKKYPAGTQEQRHVHRVATELTLIAAGKAMMNGHVLNAGDIALLVPGEPADFSAIEDTITFVVKVPCVMGDKYPA